MLLLVKIRNGVELTWESLDGQERMLVLYALLWLLVTVAAAVSRRSREQLKRELREELAADAGPRS